METFSLILILFLILSFYLSIGFYASRKIKTLRDYFYDGKSMGAIKLAATLIATQLGSGMLLGTSEQAYKLGFYGIFYVAGMSLGFLILGCGLASKMNSLNILTTAEIFETSYNSKFLKLIASGLSIISLYGILIVQMIASKKLLVSMGIDSIAIFACFWIILTCYTMLGGLTSVAIIDSIQVCVIVAIFGTAFIALKKVLSADFFSLSNLINLQQNSFSNNYSLNSLLPTLFIPTCFSLIEQDLAQRFFAAKSRTTATLGALFASFFMIAFATIPVFFGMIAKIKGIALIENSNVLIPLFSQYIGKIAVIGAVVGIIAAITSTADSLLCATASNIATDFSEYLPGKNKLKTSRIISLITGISALILAIFIKADIIFTLATAYRISVSALFVPTIIAYFNKNLKKNAGLLSVAFGIIGFIISQICLPYSLTQDCIPLIASLFGYFIGNKINQNLI